MIPQTKIEQAAKESNNGVAEVMSQFLNAAFEDGVRFAESEMGQIAQEFAEWCAKNDWHYNKSENYWCKVFHTDYTTPDLFAKFMAERNQITCPSCGSTRILDWPDKYQCRRCEHTWGR